MKTAGIVAEYNPFHNGHKYQIEKTREELNCGCIVAVMSGNFTQRGDVAVFDMYKRADMAVKNGIDLVLSIPPQFVLRSAQYYALAAISILNSLNGIDYLSFGSECGDIELLKNAININPAFKDEIKSGVTYARAVSSSEVLKEPNNTLGVEYIRALNQLKSDIIPYTLKRSKVSHNDNKSVDNLAPASLIRKMIQNNENVSLLMPEDISGLHPVFDTKIIELLNYRLLLGDEHDFENHLNISEGLNNRILKFKNAESFGELIKNVKCKRYTETRIRRALYSVLLDIKSDISDYPSHTRVLAMTKTGQDFLNKIRKVKEIDIFSKITKKDIYNHPQLKKELIINEIYNQFFCNKSSKPV